MSYLLKRFVEQTSNTASSVSTQLAQYLALNPALSVIDLLLTPRGSGPAIGSGVALTLIAIDSGTRHYAVEFVSDASLSADDKLASFFSANPSFMAVAIADLTSQVKRLAQRTRLLVMYTTSIPVADAAAAIRSFGTLGVAASGVGNRVASNLTPFDLLTAENLGNLAWPAGGRVIGFRNRPRFGAPAAEFAGIGPSCYGGGPPASTTTAPVTTPDTSCLTNPFLPSTTVTPPPNTGTTPPPTTSSTTSTTSSSTTSSSTTSTSTSSTTTSTTTSSTTTTPPPTTTSTTTTPPPTTTSTSTTSTTGTTTRAPTTTRPGPPACPSPLGPFSDPWNLQWNGGVSPDPPFRDFENSHLIVSPAPAGGFCCYQIDIVVHADVVIPDPAQDEADFTIQVVDSFSPTTLYSDSCGGTPIGLSIQVNRTTSGPVDITQTVFVCVQNNASPPAAPAIFWDWFLVNASRSGLVTVTGTFAATVTFIGTC